MKNLIKNTMSEKSQTKKENDFKELVLNMIPEDEKSIITWISASDLYYLVYGAYNAYDAVKKAIDSTYGQLHLISTYRIISSLREIKDDLKKEI